MSSQEPDTRWPGGSRRPYPPRRGGGSRTARRAADERSSVVYVIGADATRVVKIGMTINLKSRLAHIQTMSPVRVRVLFEHPGAYELEGLLHAEFGALRSHGEWFDFGDEDPVALVSSAVDRLRDRPVQS